MIGVVNGQGGTNTLSYQVASAIDQANLLINYLNFYNYHFETTSDGTFTIGSLGIIGQGGGLVDVTDTLSTDSTICDGRLYVNGTLNSPTVVIGSTGLFWDSGAIHGDVTNYGNIAPRATL